MLQSAVHGLLDLTIGVGLGAGVWLAVVAARRNQSVILTPLAVIVAFDPEDTIGIHVGGRNVTGLDAVLIVALAVTFSRLGVLRRNLAPGAHVASSAYVLMVLASFFVGYAEFKQQAVLDVAHTAAVVSLVAFLLSEPSTAKTQERVRAWLLITALLCCVDAAIHIGQRGLGNANQFFLENGQWVTVRPLVAVQAAVVAVAFLFFLHDHLVHRTRGSRELALLFFVAVLIAQQRSVWLMAIAGLAFLLPRLTFERLAVFVVAAVWALGMSVPILVVTSVGHSIEHDIAASTSSASLTSGTGADRVNSAKALIHGAEQGGITRELLGAPWGDGYVRNVGRIENYQPHDGWLQIFLRTGMVGLIALAMIFVAAFRNNSGSSRRFMTAIVVATAVFSAAYPIPFTLAPMIGLALLGDSSTSSELLSPVEHTI